MSRFTLPLYLVSTATSLFGNAAIAIVLPWLVLERTGDPALAGAVVAISAVPSAVAALVGGHLVDRIGRRRLCVVSDAGSAISVAALAVVDGVVGLDLYWFIALGVAGALFDVPGMTARETLVADVSRSSGVSLDTIASLRGALFGVAFLAGPALAGWLLAVLPAISVVWVTAGCSALAAVTIALMPLSSAEAAGSDASGAHHSSPLAGFVLIRRSRPLFALMTVSVVAAVVSSPLTALVLPAHFSALAAPSLLGVSLSAYAVGSIVGAGVYGAILAGLRWRAWVIANVAFAAAGLLIAPLGPFWSIAAAMAVCGVGAGLMQPIITVVITSQVADALRGRVFGAYAALAMVAAPLGIGLVTVVVAFAGLHAAVVALALGWIAVAVYGVYAPGLRGYIRLDATRHSARGVSPC